MQLNATAEARVKQWLQQELVKISDADADVLAEYCLALVKQDKSRDALHALCNEALVDILGDGTRSFVDHFFDLLSQLEGKTDKDFHATDSRYGTHGKHHSAISSVFPKQQANLRKRELDVSDVKGPDMASEQRRKKRICFAFQKHGVCRRGTACVYDHSESRSKLTSTDEYDPTNSSMAEEALSLKLRAIQSDQVPDEPISKDTFQNTLVLSKIPLEKYNTTSITQFFEQYGPITSVRLDRSRNTASIQYASYCAARTAFESPKPIFNNRFVGLSWSVSETFKSPRITTLEEQQESAEDVSSNAANLHSNANNVDVLAQKPTENAVEVSQASALQRQLDQLKATAAELGIHPGVVPATKNISQQAIAHKYSQPSPITRVRSLDNRSRTVRFEYPLDVAPKALEFFRALDEQEWATSPSKGTVIVCFKTRRDAEKFAVPKNLGSLLPLKTSWHVNNVTPIQVRSVYTEPVSIIK